MTNARGWTRRLGAGLCAALAASVVLAGEAAPAQTLAAPAADTVKAYDRPSDDGSAIIVQWPKPGEKVPGAYYVVEIARSRGDFDAGEFKTQIVRPSEQALMSAQPRYFGFSPRNALVYFAEVTPAGHFPPPSPPEFGPGRLDKLVADGVLLRGEANRAAAAFRLKGPDESLTRAQRHERGWLERLKVRIGELDGEAEKDRRAGINRQQYYLRLAITDGKQKAYVSRDGRPLVLAAAASPDLFAFYKLNNLVLAVTFSVAVLAFIQRARRNPNLFIRRIPGLEAVDEAIGRAAEMGRPVYFVHGLHDMDGLSTIAAVNILARVARRAVEYDVPVRVMNNRPIVTAVSQEVVQQAYTEAGRPDAYDPDDVSLVATDQFSYVAAVSGLMVRERPAAVVLLGYFYAESLLLAETGASTGAIQVAGTDAYTQLPFFITTCDYTLIGEELYAASAYMSREPKMLGSLRGQDVGKALLMAAILLGAIAMTVAAALKLDAGWIRSIFQAL